MRVDKALMFVIMGVVFSQEHSFARLQVLEDRKIQKIQEGKAPWNLPGVQVIEEVFNGQVGNLDNQGVDLVLNSIPAAAPAQPKVDQGKPIIRTNADGTTTEVTRKEKRVKGGSAYTVVIELTKNSKGKPIEKVVKEEETVIRRGKKIKIESLNSYTSWRYEPNEYGGESVTEIQYILSGPRSNSSVYKVDKVYDKNSKPIEETWSLGSLKTKSPKDKKTKWDIKDLEEIKSLPMDDLFDDLVSQGKTSYQYDDSGNLIYVKGAGHILHTTYDIPKSALLDEGDQTSPSQDELLQARVELNIVKESWFKEGIVTKTEDHEEVLVAGIILSELSRYTLNPSTEPGVPPQKFSGPSIERDEQGVFHLYKVNYENGVLLDKSEMILSDTTKRLLRPATSR